MKLYHAAAIALVGWYLMLPLIDDKVEPQPYAPMGQWDIAEKRLFFDCSRVRGEKSGLKARHLDAAKNETGSLHRILTKFAEDVDLGRCVRSDDPDLHNMNLPPQPEFKAKP
ncbi:MAG: hypothetical protein ACLQAT_26395 [Candidatus Binataceae bacterium]